MECLKNLNFGEPSKQQSWIEFFKTLLFKGRNEPVFKFDPDEGTDEHYLITSELEVSDDIYLKRLIENQPIIVVEHTLNKILSNYYYEDGAYTEENCVILDWLNLVPNQVRLHGEHMLYSVVVADRLDLLKQIIKYHPKYNFSKFMNNFHLYVYADTMECYKYACDMGYIRITEKNAFDFGNTLNAEKVAYYFSQHAPTMSSNTIVNLISGITRNGGCHKLAMRICQYLSDNFLEEKERDDILWTLSDYCCFDLMEQCFPDADMTKYNPYL